jgi:hypothetical protein
MIMNVRRVFEDATKAAITANIQVELSGWLVIIDGDLYLLEEELPEDYKQAFKIKLSDREIIYAVRQTILPLGGGESFIFHRAKVTGLLNMGLSPEIAAKTLCIQEHGHDEFVAVDITQNAISAGKARYEAALNFDFFKEMGDT